jgi:aspartyl protease family protein
MPAIAFAFLATIPAGAESVSLQAQSSMFRTDVVLNERVTVHALIDTGATFAGLCAPLARRLGLTLGGTVTLSTANGMIQGRYATLASIRIGSVVIESVTAVVQGEETRCHENVLIGMSFLQKLESMTIRDGTLTLTSRAAITQMPEYPSRQEPTSWKWK